MSSNHPPQSLMPRIHAYLDFRAYIRDWTEARRTAGLPISFTWLGSRAGCSAGHVKNILEGRRPLKPRLLDGFCKALKLSKTEATYFSKLVRFNQAEDDSEAAQLLEALVALQRDAGITAIDGDMLHYISRWWYVAIREMSICPGFREDAAWIAEHLRPRITTEAAQEALDTLRSMKLLFPRGDDPGRSTDFLLATPDWVPRPVVLRFHEESLQRAREALSTMDGADLFYRSQVGAVPSSWVPRLRAAAVAFHHRVSDILLEQTGPPQPEAPPQQVYQVMIQVLPASETLSDDSVTRSEEPA